MSVEAARAWLESWTEEHVHAVAYDEDDAQAGEEARQARAAAADETDFTLQELEEAADGDLTAYFSGHIESSIDDEVQRKVDKDD